VRRRRRRAALRRVGGSDSHTRRHHRRRIPTPRSHCPIVVPIVGRTSSGQEGGASRSSSRRRSSSSSSSSSGRRREVHGVILEPCRFLDRPSARDGGLGIFLGGVNDGRDAEEALYFFAERWVLVDELQEQGQVGFEARATVLDDAVGEIVEPDLDGEVEILDFGVLLLAEFLCVWWKGGRGTV